MLTFSLKCTICLKCKKNKENFDPKVLKTKNGRTRLSSKCAVCVCKKSKFIKKTRSKRIIE